MADLTVGVDPIRVKVTLPTWQRIRNWLAREDPIERIKVLPNFARIQIDRPDEGTAELSFWLVNFSKRTVIPERLDLSQWSWLSHSLPDLPLTTRGLGTVVGRRSLASLHVAIQLNAAAIRRIREASPADVGAAIGGNWGFNVFGLLFLQNLKRPIQCELQVPNPQTRFYWYSGKPPTGGAA